MYDCYLNKYSFTKDGKKTTLVPLSDARCIKKKKVKKNCKKKKVKIRENQRKKILKTNEKRDGIEKKKKKKKKRKESELFG